MDQDSTLDQDYTGMDDQPRNGYEVNTVSAVSALDAMRRSVEQRSVQTVQYRVPSDEMPALDGDLDLEFSRQITTHELNRWRRQARAKGARNDADIDPGKVSALVLVNKSTRLLLNGVPLVDDEGEALNLRSEEVLGITSSTNAADGVRALIGDGLVTSFGDRLITDAGFGEEVETGNPTSQD